MVKTVPGIGQGTLWTPGEMKNPGLADLEIEPTQVISFSKLLRAVSDYMDLPLSYASEEAYAIAEPEQIQKGLYIEKEDKRRKTAENLYRGVVHPSVEFADIARSPADLARHAKNRVRKSFNLEEAMATGSSTEKVVDGEGREVDRDEIEARALRSAGHQLEDLNGKVEARIEDLRPRLSSLVRLIKELRSPGKAHYRAENLNGLRVTGEQAIREAVEVASINMEWGSLTVDGIHQAVMYKIYGLPGHNNYRLRNFLPWATLTHNWMRSRLAGLQVSMSRVQRELAIYKPALDAAKETS
jgi:hypothetical protein